jgi:hypothetical protein
MFRDVPACGPNFKADTWVRPDTKQITFYDRSSVPNHHMDARHPLKFSESPCLPLYPVDS